MNLVTVTPYRTEERIMDTFDCIATKIEVRQFDGRPVAPDVKLKVLEAARLTGSSNNTQHWRFILLQDKDNISRLAGDSVSGPWVKTCAFAVIILVDPNVRGHMIDAGRALQDMQLAAWNLGVGSGIFTGVNEDKIRKDFGIPNNLALAAFLGFGYPAKKVTGKKKQRKPLSEIAFVETYGNPLDPSKSLK
jgi:nitroreductase